MYLASVSREKSLNEAMYDERVKYEKVREREEKRD